MKDNHIIFFCSFDKDGNVQKFENDKIIDEVKSDDNLTWAHLDTNRKGTKKLLEGFGFDHLIIDALLAEETRPRIIEFDTGSLIILRGVNLNKNSEPEDMVLIRMWVDEKRIITLERRRMKAVFDIKSSIESGKTIKNSAEFLYNLIYEILAVTSPFLYNLTEKLDDLEEKIMNTHDLQFREEILQIRTQSTIFRRYLAPQKDVIHKLCTSNKHWIDDWAKRHFQENLENISHMLEEIDEARDRSKILHDELSHALTEKLNKNMYKLSVITMIFMPMTFFTGLFGMNVGGIPMGTYEYGFIITSAAIFSSMFLQLFLLRRKSLLEKL